MSSLLKGIKACNDELPNTLVELVAQEEVCRRPAREHYLMCELMEDECEYCGKSINLTEDKCNAFVYTLEEQEFMKQLKEAAPHVGQFEEYMLGKRLIPQVRQILEELKDCDEELSPGMGQVRQFMKIKIYGESEINIDDRRRTKKQFVHQGLTVFHVPETTMRRADYAVMLLTRPQFLLPRIQPTVKKEKVQKWKDVKTTRRVHMDTNYILTQKVDTRRKYNDVTRSNGQRVKKIDYDKGFYEAQKRHDKRQKVKRVLIAPGSMKLKFLCDDLSRMKIEEQEVKMEYYHVKAKLKQKLSILDCPCEMDQLLLEFFDLSVRTGSYERGLQHLAFRVYKVGNKYSRDVLYRLYMALHDKLPALNVKVYSPFARKHITRGAQLWAAYEDGLVDDYMQDPDFVNFVKYNEEYRTFNHCMRRNLKMKRSIISKKNIYLDILARDFLDHFVLQEVKPTMFGMSAALGNVAALNVTGFNRMVETATAAAMGMRATMERVENFLTDDLTGGIKKIVSNLSHPGEMISTMLSGITTGIAATVRSLIGQVMSLIGFGTEYIKEIGPEGMKMITIAFIGYVKAESMVVKGINMFLILYFAGILGKIAPYISDFIKYIKEAVVSIYDSPVPTSLMGMFTSILDLITDKPLALFTGIVKVMSTISKVVLPSTNQIYRLWKMSSSILKELSFIQRGLESIPKIIEWLTRAFYAARQWLLGVKSPVGKTREWEEQYYKWTFNVNLYTNPELTDVIRTQRVVRDRAGKLYEEGLELMKEAKQMHKDTGVMVRQHMDLQRNLIATRKLKESIVRFGAYNNTVACPYHVVFTSEPGCGKTNFVHALVEAMRKMYWPDVDTEQMMYNVPITSEFMDGYTKQKGMLIDDYNMIDDAKIVSKIVYLVSNVPFVLPMANLEDKGILNESKFIISTTNSPYALPDGINCKEAILRRRKYVVEFGVDPRFKVNGVVSKEEIIKIKQRDYRKHFQEDQKGFLESYPMEGLTVDSVDDAYFKLLALKYYNNHEYYKFRLKDNITNRYLDHSVMSTTEFVEFFITDYAKHMKKEQDLLTHNLGVEFDHERLQSLAEVRTLLNEVETYRQRTAELTQEAEATETPLVNHSEVIKKQIKRTWQLLCASLVQLPETVLPAMERVEPIPDEPLAEEEIRELVDEASDDVARPTEDEFEDARDHVESTFVCPFDIYTNDAERMIYVEPDLERFEEEDFDEDSFEYDEDPSFGWFEGDLEPDIVTRLSTNFLLLINLSPGVAMAARFNQEIGGEIPEDLYDSMRWSLKYPANTNGQRYLYDIKTEWMKESCITWALLSQQRRYEIYSLYRDYVQASLTVRNVVERARTDTVNTRRAGFFSTATYRELEPLIYVIVFIALYLCLIMFVAWLFSPSSTATSYNVNPKVGKRTKLSWGPTSSKDCNEAIRRRLTDNFQLAYKRVGSNKAARCNIFYLHGNIAIFPRHFILGMEHDTTVTVTTPEGLMQENIVNSSLISVLPGTDVALVQLESGTHFYRSAIKHFVTESELEKLERTVVHIYQKEHTSLEVIRAAARVNEIIDMKLPGFKEMLKAVIYSGAAEEGTSGGIVFSTDNSIPHTLVGIQSASAKTWGAIAPITQEALSAAIAKFDTYEYEEQIEGVLEMTDCVADLHKHDFMSTPATEIFTNARVVAVMDKEHTPYMSIKTALQPSPINQHLEDTGKEPAILADWDKRRTRHEGKPHYLVKSVNKNVKDSVTPIPRYMKEEVIDSCVTFFKGTGFMNNLKELNIQEAILGHNSYVNKFDNTTSPGLPWVLEKDKKHAGKKQYLRYNEEGKIEYLDDRLYDAVQDVLGKFKRGIVPAEIQMDSMKDELRDASLGKENTTRIVTCHPMHVAIAARMLNLDFYSRIHQLAKQGMPVCVGIDVESMDSHLMLIRTLSKSGGMYCFDLDVSNWDGHFSADYFEMVVEVINRLYNDGLSTQKARRTYSIWSQTSYSQLSKFLVKRYRGMSSGKVGTAEDNSIAHMMLLYICWRLIMADEGRYDIISFEEFRNNVVSFFYGDDMFVSVDASVIDIFNGVTVANRYSRLGWPATPAAKGEEFAESKPWWEIMFLKRRFKFSDDRSMVLAPIELSTIRSLFSWQRGNDVGQFYENMRNAFRFLVHHGRELFQEHKKVVNTALERERMPLISFNYDDMFMEFVQKYSGHHAICDFPAELGNERTLWNGIGNIRESTIVSIPILASYECALTQDDKKRTLTCLTTFAGSQGCNVYESGSEKIRYTQEVINQPNALDKSSLLNRSIIELGGANISIINQCLDLASLYYLRDMFYMNNRILFISNVEKPLHN